ncbi:MAG: PhnA domain-containing protein, partial [Pseudobdellovibrio sp.]
RGEMQAEHYGTFVEIEKPTKLSFIFSVQQSTDTDYIEIFFNSNSKGCEIILQQEVKPEFKEYIEKIKMGWSTILNKLDRIVSNQNQESTELVTKDSLGQALSEGDSVKTIKDLKVKGSSMVVKRGTVVKKIHLISGNDEEVDCRVDGVALSLETQWLVKV